jgi:hypothetical protein
VTTNNFAFVANRLDAGVDLHCVLLIAGVVPERIPGRSFCVVICSGKRSGLVRGRRG